MQFNYFDLRRKYDIMKRIMLSLLFIAVCISLAWAGDAPPTAESNKHLIDLVQTHADYVWTLVAAALVFFMQAGFALVESGFTRAKNAINIMMKNLMDFSIGSLAFWAIGFGIMFGASSTGWAPHRSTSRTRPTAIRSP